MVTTIDDFEDTASNAGWDEEVNWTRTSSPSSTENGTPTIKSGSRVLEGARSTEHHTIGGSNLSTDPSTGQYQAWFWLEYASSSATGIERCANYDSNGNLVDGFYLGTKDGDSSGKVYFQRLDSGSVANEVEISSTWVGNGEWTQLRWNFDGTTHSVELYTEADGIWGSASFDDGTYTSGDAGVRTRSGHGYCYTFYDLMEGPDSGTSVTVTSPVATASSTAPVPAISTGVGVTAPAATASSTAPVPDIDGGTAITAPAATASSTAPVPDIDGGTAIAAPAATASGAATAPTIHTGIGVGPPTATASSTAPAPTVTAGTGVAVSAPAATASTSAPRPSVLVAGTYTATPSAATASATALAPTITKVKHLSVTPPTASAITITPEPTFRQHQPIAPPEATASAVAMPIAHVGDRVPVTVTSPTASARAETPVPTVVDRYPVVTRVPPAMATAQAPEPARVEAVEPIETLPAGIELDVPSAPTSAQFVPDITESLHERDQPDLELETPANHRMADLQSLDRSDAISPNPPQRVVTEDVSAYTPVREVYLNDQLVSADRDIEVSASEYGFATASVTLYNLDLSLWRDLSQHDSLRIELGWQEAGTEPVFDGEITIKRKRERGADRARIIRGRDRGAEIVTSRLSRSFTDLAPHRIVEQLIADIDGLGRGYIGTGSQRLSGTYTLGGGKEINDWLDKLAQKATKQTDKRWVWYLEGGKLHFHPATAQATDHVGFSLEKSAQEANPVGLVGENQPRQQYEVLLRCEPLIRRGLTTSLAGGLPEIDPSNVYRIASYLHESSTVTGRHHTTATFSPLFKDIDDIIR